MADVVENLNTLAKEVFGDAGVPDLVPQMTKLQKAIPFSQKDMTGLKYVQTVRLAYPTGFTHALGDGTAGAFTLQDSIGGTQKRAELTPSQILLRDQMSYEDANKCAGSEKSFKDGTKYFFEGLQSSMRKRLESSLFYGGASLGICSSSANASATSTVITFTAASWAPGIWVGNEGMQFNVYTSATSGTIVSSGADAVFSLTSVDVPNRKITVGGTSTGIAALDTSISSGGRAIFFVGAYSNEMSGVHQILANTGTLFNIAGGTYAQWVAAQYAPTSGALTFAKVKKGIALGVSKGLDCDLDLYVNPSTWDDLNSDISALRRTDKSEVSKVDIGSEEIVYHSQNGKCRVVPSIYVKEGFAYGMSVDNWKRVGSADVTFNTPGFAGETFLHLGTKAGVESRVYTSQAIISLAPAKQLYISNIVNTVF